MGNSVQFRDMMYLFLAVNRKTLNLIDLTCAIKHVKDREMQRDASDTYSLSILATRECLRWNPFLHVSSYLLLYVQSL